MKFNEKLKELRLNKNMTQEDLANKLNISRQSISKWEQGLSEPNIETLKNIANIFEISISELLEDDKIQNQIEEKQIKREYKLFLTNLAIFLVMALLTPVIIKMVKDVIPMHYNFLGEITRYGSKWELMLLFITFSIPFIISIFIHFNFQIDLLEHLKTFIIVQIIIVVTQIIFLGLFLWMGISNMKNINEDIIPFITSFFAILFIVLSIFSSPIFNKKRNAIFGFRTFFTLKNQEAWEKINLTQSISGFVFSTIIYLITLFTFKKWSIYLIVGIIISIIPTFIYHEILRIKHKRKEN